VYPHFPGRPARTPQSSAPLCLHDPASRVLSSESGGVRRVYTTTRHSGTQFTTWCDRILIHGYINFLRT
jgi:hypothetical protein